MADSGSDTEPDEGACPAGSGPRGIGPPLQVGRGSSRRDLCDGGGLCSVGRWAPRDRPKLEAPRLQQIRSAVKRAIVREDANGHWSSALFAKLCRGELQCDPFPASATAELREYAAGLYDGDEMHARPRAEDRPQAVQVRLLQAMLRDAGDPDWQGMSHFCRGIRVGVGARLPRTPAVFRRKRHWRLAGQEDKEAWKLASVESVWRDNYTSAKDHVSEIGRQLDECVDNGWAIKLSEAEAAGRFPKLVVSSLGAVVKHDAAGDVHSIRMVLDGTHGVNLNTQIRVRDQDRCPTAADIRRVQRAQARSTPGVGLAVDIKSAHRLPAVDPRDWHLQGCRARRGGDIFVFTVGVFGMSSIAYWWARLGGAMLRLLNLMTDPDDELWLLLMADDIKIDSTSSHPERAVVWVLWLVIILGFPFSWPKTQGGARVEWIGYDVWVRERRLGITVARASWAVGWLRRVVRDRSVAMGEFRSGLGKLGFICGALEYERPFLAPCYAFLALSPIDSVRPIPLYVSCVLEHLAERIERRRTYPSDSDWISTEFSPRVDAKADGADVAIGGWLPRRDANGILSKAASPWFSIRVEESTTPWAFCRSGEAFRTIAALEALATLVAVVVFAPLLPRRSSTPVVVTSVTDNQGNGFALTRLMTTRFPLCLIVMELSAQLEAHNMRLEVEWAPRESNQEADDLSNGISEGFTERHRTEIDLATFPWIVLNRLVSHALDFERTRPPKRKRG